MPDAIGRIHTDQGLGGFSFGNGGKTDEIRVRAGLRMQHLGGGVLEGEDGNVVFLTPSLGGLSDGGGSLVDQRGYAIKAQQLPFRIASLDDTVGDEREPVTRSQFAVPLFGARLGDDSQWKPVGYAEFFAVPVGRKMTGVANDHGTVFRNQNCRASCKTGNLTAEDAIQVREHLCGPSLMVIAQSSDNRADGHGGFQAFTAHVADNDEHGAVAAGQDVKEVASHLPGRVVFTLDKPTLETGQALWDEEMLHLLRLPHVVRHADVFALLFCETHQEDDEDGDRHGGANDLTEYKTSEDS